MDVDGSGERSLEPVPGNAASPDASTNGRGWRIAGDRRRSAQHLRDEPEGGPRQARSPSGPAAFGDFRPRWSPTRQRIVFIRNDSRHGSQSDIYIVHADGTDLRRLTARPSRVEECRSGRRTASEIILRRSSTPARHSVAGCTRSTLTTAATIACCRSWPRRSSRASGTAASTRASGTDLSDPGVDDRRARRAARRSISQAARCRAARSTRSQRTSGSPCPLPGDFDMQVDYELLTWPPARWLLRRAERVLRPMRPSRGCRRRSTRPRASATAPGASGADFCSAVEHDRPRRVDASRPRRAGRSSPYYRSPGADWKLILTAGGVD